MKGRDQILPSCNTAGSGPDWDLRGTLSGDPGSGPDRGLRLPGGRAAQSQEGQVPEEGGDGRLGGLGQGGPLRGRQGESD